MTPSDWSQIRHFLPSENWGDSAKMSLGLLKELDLYREFVGLPIVVSCGTQGVHCEQSEHALGIAVDIVFPNSSRDESLDLALAAMRFRFTGIGIYSAWEYDGKPVVGMHLDIRPSARKELWIGAGKPPQYVGFDSNGLVRYNLMKLKFSV